MSEVDAAVSVLEARIASLYSIVEELDDAIAVASKDLRDARSKASMQLSMYQKALALMRSDSEVAKLLTGLLVQLFD